MSDQYNLMGVAELRYENEQIENIEALLSLVFIFDKLGFHTINQQHLIVHE